MAIIGNDTIGTSAHNNGDILWGTVATIPENGTATKISAHLWRAESTPATAICALYDHDTHALVASTEERTDILAEGWYDFNFPSPPSLIAGKTYDILIAIKEVTVVWTAGIEADIPITDGICNQWYTYTSSWSPMLTPDYGYANFGRTSIYCTYGPPSITITPTSANLQVNQPQTFAATISGGAPPYTVTWIDEASGATIGTELTYDFVSATAGTYRIHAIATDASAQQAISATVVINVLPIHTLSVNSTPIQGVPLTIERVS